MSSHDNVITLQLVKVPKISDKTIEIPIYHGFTRITLSYLK